MSHNLYKIKELLIYQLILRRNFIFIYYSMLIKFTHVLDKTEVHKKHLHDTHEFLHTLLSNFQLIKLHFFDVALHMKHIAFVFFKKIEIESKKY